MGAARGRSGRHGVQEAWVSAGPASHPAGSGLTSHHCSRQLRPRMQQQQQWLQPVLRQLGLLLTRPRQLQLQQQR